MKPVLFLLNDRATGKPGGTTPTLMLACHRRGHPVYVTDVVNLEASSMTSLYADALRISPKKAIDSTRDLVAILAQSAPQRINLEKMKAIFVRTTPGKDISRTWAHRLALEIMRFAKEAGIRVLNDPAGLQRASSKLYTVCLPEEFVPRTLVCHSLSSVQRFANDLNGPFVMKPLLGSQGRDVFFLDGPASINIRQVVDILGRTGYLVVQEFIPEAVEGDIRVLTLDDSLVTGNSAPLGIRRTPASGEMRSNVSLGGTASIVELTENQTKMCLAVAAHLKQDGIRFSGLDLIGEKIVEVNVFSPSGLQELNRHLGVDISEQVAEQLIEG